MDVVKHVGWPGSRRKKGLVENKQSSAKVNPGEAQQ